MRFIKTTDIALLPFSWYCCASNDRGVSILHDWI